jgi:hypothetical protein
MATPTRTEVLHVLQNEWATYVARYQGLSDSAQTAFLKKQGYARFADLLAHIMGWWEIGQQNIKHYLAEPQYQPENYNIDELNARAVDLVKDQSEASLLEAFEQKRAALLQWVAQLPEEAFENKKAVNQFNMELIGHLNDHEIRG